MPAPSLETQRSTARDAFVRAHGAAPTLAAYAPGRVNLIGDHTDYTGGLVLPMTIDRGTWALVRPRDHGEVAVHAAGFGRASGAVGEPSGAERPLWARYVLGAAREVARLGAEAEGARTSTRGADLYVTGDVPVGAGLSSSASLTVAVTLALAAAWDGALEETAAALLAQRVEHTDAGVHCGVMDQVAVRSGRAGHAVLLDCRSLEHRDIALPPRTAVVVVDSGVGRTLAGSAYNERRAAVEQAAEVLGGRGVTGPGDTPLGSLRDATAADLDAHADALGDLLPFARHVVTENARVLDAAAALVAGEPEAAGRLMTASHASLRDDYAVSGPELDALVLIGKGEGAYGSRLTGAGFGGCTVHLVPADRADPFAEAVVARYSEQTGRDGAAFVVRENRQAGVTEVT